MATTAQSIIDKAEEILQDASNDRYSEAELLAWLNFGQKAIVREKPDANPVRESVLLTSGLWQSLPTTGILLLDVTMNMGTDGTSPGTPIILVDRKWIDTALPTWTVASASDEVKHLIYDPKSQPKSFMVYPQSTGSNYIEIVTAKLPADVAAIGNNITIGDEYAEALLDYVLFRAYTRDAEYRQNADRAIAHWQSFLMILGKLDEVELLLHPKKGQGKD